jgi:C1A family cysteine protease
MPQYTLKDGTSSFDRRLDRIPAFDQRSMNFPISAALNTEQQELISRTWTVPRGTPVLNQGEEGACCGFGVTNELLFYPVPVRKLDATFAREKIYWVAQRDDPWPGGSYPNATPRYEGTSVLYAIKAASDLGYYTEYRWAASEKEMALGVGYLGPAIIGVDWYEGMFKPDSKGFIHPTGDKMGGHCTLVIGVNVKAGYYTIHNSWGPSWGDNGRAKIRREDMAKLMAANGEVCIITGRTLPAPAKKTAAKRAADILPDRE